MSTGLFQGKMPLTTEKMLKLLDEAVPVPGVGSMSELAAEEGRLNLAFKAGRRAVADDLLAAFKRQTSEQASGE